MAVVDGVDHRGGAVGESATVTHRKLTSTSTLNRCAAGKSAKRGAV